MFALSVPATGAPMEAATAWRRTVKSSPNAGAPHVIRSRPIRYGPIRTRRIRLHSTKKQASELKGFLADPHPKMPNMSLSRSEIADIVAYIKTLGR